MNKYEKRIQTIKCLDEMIEDTREYLLEKLDTALLSGGIADRFYGDDDILARCIFDSFCRDRPFQALSDDNKKEFNNIYILI